MSIDARRHQGLRPYLALLGGLPVFVALMLGWTSPAVIFPKPPSPLHISQVNSTVGPDGLRLDVSVLVQNVSTERVQGRVWWQLGVPGPPKRRWERRAYQSSLTDVDLPTGEVVLLKWREQAMVPPGQFELAAWAQLKKGSRLVGSDGRLGAPTMLSLNSTDGRFLRRGPARGGVSVEAVKSTPAGPGRFTGEVTLHNGTAIPRQGRLRWSASSIEGPRAVLVDWWRRGPGVFGGDVDVAVSAQSDATIQVSRELALPAGRFGLRFTLNLADEDEPASARAEWPDEDVLYIGSPIVSLGQTEP